MKAGVANFQVAMTKEGGLRPPVLDVIQPNASLWSADFPVVKLLDKMRIMRI